MATATARQLHAPELHSQADPTRQTGSGAGKGEPSGDLLAPAPVGVSPGDPDARCVEPVGVLASSTTPMGGSHAGGDRCLGVYAGDLLEDILDYRALRARALCATLGRPERTRLEALEERLRERQESEQPSLRAYHRFTYTRPAKLRIAGARERTREVTIDNLSAGGVKLLGAGEPKPGQRVWLQVERADGTSVVLPARVAWGRDLACGLMFAGAPASR